ncbi:hypothetical protein GCM10023116_01750 [Kistimonas scapharcae]|uniref:Uncharacterized protein n=1 Tax=Kistimonas scapharcae TaxID=1036133 RepID=A0ABP8UVI3_9GAMM
MKQPEGEEMTVTSFVVDEKTDELLETLKVTFSAKSKAEVIRKSLRLAQLVAKKAGDDHEIILSDKSETYKTYVTL